MRKRIAWIALAAVVAAAPTTAGLAALKGRITADGSTRSLARDDGRQ
jgi:hypothetical protein